MLRAEGCLVTPGLVNTHHHIYQNLTRAYRPATVASLFDWLTTLYPRWSRLDEEAAYVSAWIGLAELALGGCTTSTDHLYVHPRGAGDLISAEIRAATELAVRFHPTRGSMSLSQKDGGLPPDSVVQDDDEILADSERLVKLHHDRAHGAMVRIALAPCSPFSVTSELMVRTAELAERLDVRLHTHLAEDPDEDRFAAEKLGRRTIDHFEAVGWMTDRSWVAHCIYPDPSEVARLGRAGVGVAHCPSSNMMIGGGGIAPVADLRAAGSPVGLGCDGSSSTDSASLWMEARNAMLLGRLRGGPASTGARDALEIATRGGAGCLGRSGEIGELTVGAVGDLVVLADRRRHRPRGRAQRSGRGVAAVRAERGAPHRGGRPCDRARRRTRERAGRRDADLASPRRRALPGRLTREAGGTDKNHPMAVLSPATIDEALDALAAHPEAHVLAGGTDFMVEVNFGHRRPDDVVALGRVEELRSWSVAGDTIRLGGGVTCTQLMDRAARGRPPGARTGRPDSRLTADPQRSDPRRQSRHRVTGGRLAARALDARRDDLVALGDNEPPALDRRVPRRPQAHRARARRARRRGRRPDRTRTAGVPQGRRPQRDGDRDRQRRARSAGRHGGGGGGLGWSDGVAHREAEAWLSAQTDGESEATATEFGRRVAAEVRPIDDHRSTAEYRRRAVEVMAARALRRVAAA